MAPTRIVLLIFPGGCQPREQVVSPSEALNAREQPLIVLKMNISESGHRERAQGIVTMQVRLLLIRD